MYNKVIDVAYLNQCKETLCESFKTVIKVVFIVDVAISFHVHEKRHAG